MQFIAVYTTWRGFQLLATLYQFLAQLDKMAAFTASLAKLAIAALELQGPVAIRQSVYSVIHAYCAIVAAAVINAYLTPTATFHPGSAER